MFLKNWLSPWNYRKSHTINSASGAGTNYQVKIIAHYGKGTDYNDNSKSPPEGHVYLYEHSRSDFGDIRFTKEDGLTLLDYWMEEKVDSDYAIFWVEISENLSLGNAKIYIYYGNNEATSISNAMTTDIGQLREHDTYGDENPEIAFSISDETWARIDSTVEARGSGYIFFVVPTSWLNGKYLKWKWQGSCSSGIGHWHVKILDDKYDRKSMSDFKDDQGFVPKGAGFLQIFSKTGSSFGPTVEEELVDLSDATSEWVTVMFEVLDTNTNASIWAAIDFIEVNTGQGGEGNICRLEFDDSICMEQTGTDNDYGLEREFTDPEPTHGSWGIQETSNWLEGWLYRKSHVLNAASQAGTNYQIKIKAYYGEGTDSDEKVYLNTKCRSDFGDVRFTGEDGQTELDYWMEKKVDGNYAIFWVEIQGDLNYDQTIFVYYGKNDATTTSNGDNTFLFFDDFETFEGWTNISAGSFEVINSFLHGKGTYNNFVLRPLSHTDIAIFGKFKVTNLEEDLRGIEFAYRANGDYSNGYLGGAWRRSPYFPSSPYTGITIHRITTKLVKFARTINTDIFYILEVRVKDSTHEVEFNRDGSPLSTTDNTYTTGSHIGVRMWSPYFYLDWIVVRKYVDPEPSHGSWGEEEEGFFYKSLELSFSISDDLFMEMNKILGLKISFKAETKKTLMVPIFFGQYIVKSLLKRIFIRISPDKNKDCKK